MEIDDDMVVESFSPTTQSMLAQLDDSEEDCRLRVEMIQTRRQQLGQGGMSFAYHGSNHLMFGLLYDGRCIFA